VVILCVLFGDMRLRAISARHACNLSPAITGTIFYHVGGIEREVAREIWSKRSEKEMFECLAWLYDGFALPQ
jgi:hypothetical protein